MYFFFFVTNNFVSSPSQKYQHLAAFIPVPSNGLWSEIIIIIIIITTTATISINIICYYYYYKLRAV